MPTPSSGAISLQNIRDNFYNYTNADGFNYGTTNSNLYNLNYYRGKKYRKAGVDTIFSSGSISFNAFYNSDGNCACDCVCACSTDSSCFVADSIVLLASGAEKKIVDLNVGDHLATRLPDIKNTVVAMHIVKLGSRKLYSINNKILTTGDHLFKTPLGWAAIEPDLYKNIRSGVVKHTDNILVNYGLVNASDVTQLELGVFVNKGYTSELEKINSIVEVEADSSILLYCPILDTANEFIVEGVVADAPMPIVREGK